MSQSQSSKPTASRRTFLKVATVGAGTVTTGGVGIRHSTQRAQAFPPVVVAGAATAAAWLIRDHGVLDWQQPPDGLSAEALHNEIYTTLQARAANLFGTYTDNRNLVQFSEDTVYTDATIRVIDAFNDGKDKQTAIDEAQTYVDSEYTTVQKNFARSFNEFVYELFVLCVQIDDHPDLTFGDVFSVDGNPDLYGYDTGASNSGNGMEHVLTSVVDGEPSPDNGYINLETYQLADGSDFDVWEMHEVSYFHAESMSDPSFEILLTGSQTFSGGNGETYEADGNVDRMGIFVDYPDQSGHENIFPLDKFNDLWQKIEDAHTNVRDSITLYADEVYDLLEVGEIDTTDLITPSMRATMYAEEQDAEHAHADLVALGIGDVEENVTISEAGTEEVVTGTLQSTADGLAVEEGSTYDPDTDGDFYFTYQTEEGEITTVLLEDPFVVEEIEGEESSLTFGRTYTKEDQDYLTEEDFHDLLARYEELIEKYEESQSGGGGGILPDTDVSGRTIAIVAAALVGIGFLSNN